MFDALQSIEGALLASFVMALAGAISMLVIFLFKRLLGIIDATAAIVARLQIDHAAHQVKITNLEREVFQ